ncbi:MAG: GNAT family N-acetyltransferase [Bosea sp. (in: a-proteobacteria)]|uniref:GNAT family N-acetyltransferase n=1 Tax=Bosea sp. (in: a-proteobacteria) TaxID=1871050 RepID=UPI002735930A|nr:GNAT family N-acetyltransferase [Bosea sp. (in: a-proteobacteria)]MDP3255060.1 GNAT family N-acetyltransferase [Bosea sp. (in: a-proteobacteria)]MDP3319147.1 GNAT family N-acetyltransferase [Bosea sp. (in: a-proteobacteria)]
MTALLSIRPLTATDAATYRALRLQALRDHPEAFGASYEDEAARSLETTAKRLDGGPLNCIFGAFAGDYLVGTAGFVVPDRSTKFRHKGLLVGVHVAPAHRGKALGRRLVAAVIDHARSHVVLLQAAVGVANAPALRLYESLGFRHYGREEKALRVDGAFVDEALIVLDFAAEG